MEHNDLRIGLIVRPVEPAAMSSLCTPSFHLGVRSGVIVGLHPDNPQAVDVRWIDFDGPQRYVYTVHAAQLALHPARPQRSWRRRRTPQRDTILTAEPKLQIRNVKLAPGRTSMLPTGLAFHCIADANAAMHEIFTAKEPFKPKLRRDRKNSVPGALAVETTWIGHTDVYRIEAAAAN